MPVDTSIYNALLQRPKSIAEYDAEATQAQTNQLALQMQRAKMGEYQRSVDDDQQMRGLVGTFGADKEANYNKLLGAGRLKEAQSYEKTNLETQKAQRDQEKADIEGHFKKFELAGQIIGGVNDQASWDRARAQTAQVFGQAAAEQMPAVYDPRLVEEKRAQAMGVKEQLEQQWKAKGFDLEERQFGETVRNNKEQTAATRRGHDISANTAAKRLAFDKSQVEGNGPDASEAMIDAIGTGRMAPPSGYALRNPKILAMMERVGQKYPEYDATEYAGKTKAMRDFTTGKQGDSIRSFAVASDHLTQLKGLIGALENKDIPLVNKYGNIIAQQTGSTAPTNFDAAKGIVAKEVLKSIVAGGGGVEERQELAHLLDNAKTTKQLNGVVDTYLHLMGAQREGLERQYEVSTGRKDAKTRFNYEKSSNAAAENHGGKPSLDDIFGKK